MLMQRNRNITEAAMRLYNIYPRHVGRAAALNAIAKAMAKESYEFLLEAVTEYAEARRGQDSQFTPHPQTWFNQERYHDDRSEWSPKQSGPSKAARDAYETLCGLVRSTDFNKAPKYPDERSRTAVRLLGGWTTFSSWNTSQLESRRTRFIEAYDGINQLPTTPSPVRG